MKPMQGKLRSKMSHWPKIPRRYALYFWIAQQMKVGIVIHITYVTVCIFFICIIRFWQVLAGFVPALGLGFYFFSLKSTKKEKKKLCRKQWNNRFNQISANRFSSNFYYNQTDLFGELKARIPSCQRNNLFVTSKKRNHQFSSSQI